VALSSICLDTSAYSHFKRGTASAVDALTAASAVLVPVIVLGELRVGFRLGARPDVNERELAAFLARDVVESIDVDDEVASIYADIVVDLRRAGTPVPTNDVWIGAIAVRMGVSVVTYDVHFEKMRRVSVRRLVP
jgi:tRNA(fMet)-specific endonuclease VapC